MGEKLRVTMLGYGRETADSPLNRDWDVVNQDRVETLAAVTAAAADVYDTVTPVISGGTEDDAKSEAEVIRDTFVPNGVSGLPVEVETASASTEENVQYICETGEYDVDIIVASKDQIGRAALVWYDMAGGDSSIGVASSNETYSKRGEMSPPVTVDPGTPTYDYVQQWFDDEDAVDNEYLTEQAVSGQEDVLPVDGLDGTRLSTATDGMPVVTGTAASIPRIVTAYAYQDHDRGEWLHVVPKEGEVGSPIVVEPGIEVYDAVVSNTQA